MYFLSDEERRYLIGNLLPRARRSPVHPELRGWNWREPPLLPAYDVRLGVYEIAGKYCRTGRDVYLRRVLGVHADPNRAMREGVILHRALVDVVLRAKAMIYTMGAANSLLEMQRLLEPAACPSEEWVLSAIRAEEGSELSDAEVEGLRQRVAILQAFEYHRIISRIEDVLARQPRVGPDSLVALALPVTVEQQLDGSLLGLSSHLSVDAVPAFEPMVFDVKFGPREDFHRLSTTAYALVLESIYEQPVDVGCVIYARFVRSTSGHGKAEGERLLVERDLHLIDDELRQYFVEERDERMRMVAEEIDPGISDSCYDDCPYTPHCHSRRRS